MEKSSDLETKYQKLATEYSKIRSQATVLKKAVLDEQAKNLELKDLIKKHEQHIRKHDQEMESLTFRNEQLTKRITVLQHELQGGNTSSNKKNKNKINDSTAQQSDTSVLNEELHKKILENAQLVSSMADKDFEISDCTERIEWLQSKITTLQKELDDKDIKYREEIEKNKKQLKDNERKLLESPQNSVSSIEKENGSNTKSVTEELKKTNYWKGEADRWRTECEMLRSKPSSNEHLTEFYESQIRENLEAKQLAQSEVKTLWAENNALTSRLDNIILENKNLETFVDKRNEELNSTIDNYKLQLDAMTEHLAAQNDKITKQCDEIQILKHKLTLKK